MAVKYLHIRGIIHCDIKPQNIFIDKEKKAYLGDLGSSRKCNANVPFIFNTR